MKILVAAALLLLAPGAAGQQSPSPADQATVADLIGHAERRVTRAPERWVSMARNDRLAPDSALRTAVDSAVLLALPGGHVMRVGEKTTLELTALGQGKAFTFGLVTGRIWSFVDKAQKPEKYEVETASMILGVSGTVFSIAHEELDDEVDVSVENGAVKVRRGRVEKVVGAGLQMRVQNARLGFAAPHAQTKATQAMWKTVGSAEGWAKPNGRLRLNRQVEAGARALGEERQRERAGAGAARGGGAGRRGR